MQVGAIATGGHGDQRADATGVGHRREGASERRQIGVVIDAHGDASPFWGRRVTRVPRLPVVAGWTNGALRDYVAALAADLRTPRRRRSAHRGFGGSATDVAAARGFARLTAMRWGLVPDDLELVVDEVATNSVVHGRSPFVVALTLLGRRARVEVSDRSAAMAYVPDAGLHSLHGRGLLIVDHLAQRWGCEPALNGGKRVWAELRVQPQDTTSVEPALAEAAG